MAMQFEKSRFEGIDLSPVQIQSGREMVAELSATNLKLAVHDILELEKSDLGCYDYIIAHGVYSWVPAEVQQKILLICRDHLSENGLAYVSYNSYPGWHGKQALQRILRYHTRRLDDPRDKAGAALSLLAAYPGLEESPNDPGIILVQRLLHDLENIEDPLTYLVHEYLVDTNEPLYFRDFLDRVEAAGLRYVDDAYPGSTALDRLPPSSRQWVSESFTDIVEQQQYVDFICNTSFRRSLLCRSGISLDQDVTYDRLLSLNVTATCRHHDSRNGVVSFRSDPGRVFSVEHAALRKALDRLVMERPRSLSVGQILSVLGTDVSDDQAAHMIDSLLRNAAIELTAHPCLCTLEIAERPYVSRLVRYQSRHGTVTNAAHRPFGLVNAFEQHLVSLLDGTRTVSELIDELKHSLTPDKPVSDAEYEKLVRGQLQRLVGAGLLQDPECECL
jgi:methyltransferase-like protein